jgi:hypothetical protein
MFFRFRICLKKFLLNFLKKIKPNSYSYEVDFFLLANDSFEKLIIENETNFWIRVKDLKLSKAKKKFYGLEVFLPNFIKKRKIKEATKRMINFHKNYPELFL